MSNRETKMILRSIRVEKKDIAYVRWMLESHDGMATPTTRPGTDDVLDLLVAPDFFEDFNALLAALSEEIFVETVTSPETTSLQG
jgi:hypothetical protein